MLEPKLPTKCGWCEDLSANTVTEAINRGWYFSVFAVRNRGTFQLVGCPKHKAGFDKACQTILKTGIPPVQAERPEEVETIVGSGSQIALDIKGFVSDVDDVMGQVTKLAKTGKKILDRFNRG